MFGPWKLSHSFLLGTKVLGKSMSADLLLDFVNFYKGEPSQGNVFRFPALVVIAWESEPKSVLRSPLPCNYMLVLLCNFFTSGDKFVSIY